MTRAISYAQALREAVDQEMSCDPSVIVMGLGVDDCKGIYGTTRGLLEKFGSVRVFDTPLAEDGMTGVAIGAALGGLRPIHVHIRMDFLLLAMNQIVNIAAKSRYMYGGSVCVPLVIRSIIGKSWGQGGQHSQGLYSFFMHVPGLKVVAPTTPYDAKGCLIQAIRDDNPVLFVEHRLLHEQKGPVPEEPYTVPFGKARLLREGAEATLVGISYMAVECLRAHAYLKGKGIGTDVIDPVSLSPLDTETIVRSVHKTGKLMVVDCGWTTCGAGAEIIARVIERLQGQREIQVQRLGFAPVTCPTTHSLEGQFYPNARTIASRAYGMIHQGRGDWLPSATEPLEAAEFKGPF